MKKNIFFIFILANMVVFFTAFYIIVNALKQIYSSHSMIGEYTTLMAKMDKAYIYFHRIEITWIIISLISLGIVIDEVIRWAFKKDKEKSWSA